MNYEDTVFINCPFDQEFFPHLQAIVFTVYRCGFLPISSLSEDNGLDNRLTKIQKLVALSRYGIHDISRTQLNSHGFPRFNMPFELGLFFGAQKFGSVKQKNKNALIFEHTKFTYQNYFSDLNGIDTKAHENNNETIIQCIRDWLKTASARPEIPGHLIIITEFTSFQSELPALLSDLNLELATLLFNDLCVIIEEYLKRLMPVSEL